MQRGPRGKAVNQDCAVGIDFGATTIKVAAVDCRQGRRVAPLLTAPTPKPSTPSSVLAACSALVQDCPPGLPVGLAVPAPVIRGSLMTAWHIDPAWVGFNPIRARRPPALTPLLGVLNDADAAALGEAAFGVARGRPGVGLVLTLGTAIGSALLLNGQLVPNTEFGHVEIGGVDAGKYAAASIKAELGMEWEAWASRLSEFIALLDGLLWPDYVILTGAITEDADRFMPFVQARPPVDVGALVGWSGVAGAGALARRFADGQPS